MKNSKGFNLISVIVIICVTSVISAITTGVIISNNYGLSYKSVNEDEKLNEFLKAYSNIVDNYYENVDKEKMLDAAINGMLNYLGDNYTTYLNSDQSKELEKRLAGSYEGIGISLQGQQVASVVENGPAARSGILVGDKVSKVNGTDVSSLNSGAISALITTSKKKSVTLLIERNGESLEFNVSIESIPLSSVEEKLLENNIGYIKMDIFSKNLAEQVKTSLNNLKNQGMNRLIIDLRDNTGGYLDSAEKTASLLLEKGKLIYSLQDKNKKEDYYDETDEYENIPIVILINNNTASAAEILAAALKDSYSNTTIVGEKSFGKGKVQQTYDLSDGSKAKYTSAKWLRPNGDCIDTIGISPDVEASLSYEYDENGNEIATIDSQLSKAIEVIGAK
ncbi:S41 family peptidase [bacterium]|nr:S41 family peptidase [bacterium]